MNYIEQGTRLLKTPLTVVDPYIGEVTRTNSGDTIRHCHRVGLIAQAMAREHGYDYDLQYMVRSAGNIHDLGKVVTPPEILLAPRKLTPEEGKIIAQHPTDGHRLLQEYWKRAPWQIMDATLHHHEAVSGKGYPHHQRKIHEITSFVAMADVFDALAQDRPYKRGWRRVEVFNYIEGKFGEVFPRHLQRAFRRWYGLDEGFSYDQMAA